MHWLYFPIIFIIGLIIEYVISGFILLSGLLNGAVLTKESFIDISSFESAILFK